MLKSYQIDFLILLLRGGSIKNWNTPLYNAINEYIDSKPLPYHMPGHKLGRGIPEEVLKKLATLDLTEIPGLDNLHEPKGVIREAQALAAEAFGADRTYFLVNGSTCGIHSIIMTLCKPGDKLVVARDCHKSVIGGMMLAGVNPVYIAPDFNNVFGISTTIDPNKLKRVLNENQDAVGVLITRPNYYGICSEIEKIAEIVHSYDMMLVVDEAHGAHLSFYNLLPKGALEGGADICVQSAHKTLPALTQGSYLHVNSKRVDLHKLEFYLKTLQTSSPSYIIMALLDIARYIMSEKGSLYLECLLGRINSLSQAINKEEGIRLLSDKELQVGSLDKTRIVINMTQMGLTGYKAEEVLRKAYNLQVEMSDFYNIVCIATIADGNEEINKLNKILKSFCSFFKESTPLTDKYKIPFSIPTQKAELKDILHTEYSLIKLNKAAGRISKGIITPYPPGIPIICPGEIIMEEVVEYIYNIVSLGGNVNGLNENCEVPVLSQGGNT